MALTRMLLTLGDCDVRKVANPGACFICGNAFVIQRRMVMPHAVGMELSRVCGVWLVIAVAGCGAEVTASSRSYLGPSQSGVVTHGAPHDVALEVTRLFEVRGYALADQRVDTPAGERVLRFTKPGAPELVSLHPAVYGPEIGSVFYAWVTPRDGGATVSLLGKPTINGVEPCTRDDVLLPCSHVSLHASSVPVSASGRAEADVARGVLSQLSLEGYAIAPLPASAPAPTSDPAFAAAMQACQAQRRELLLQVLAEPSAEEKRRLYDRVPRC